MKLRILFIVAILIAGIMLFYPKNVAGPLCGPVCPSIGLHTYSQPCLGIKISRNYIDSFSVDCFGVPIGKKECYGRPYANSTDTADSKMDCNYPCNDEAIWEMCESQPELVFNEVTINCEKMKAKCIIYL